VSPATAENGRGAKLRPVRALNAWLNKAGISRGPVFLREPAKGDKMRSSEWLLGAAVLVTFR
jgi:hypothetical protein